MSEPPNFDVEKHLRLAANNLPYPPTPDFASQGRHRILESARPQGFTLQRIAWAAALMIILLAGLLAVPGVRAQVLEFLQVGIVRIFLVEPTPTMTPTSTVTRPAAQAEPGASTLLPPPPQPPVSTPLVSLLDLAGETSLEEAARNADILIELPTYPPDLGMPDRVYLQRLDGQMLVLVWLDPADTEKVHLSLHLFSVTDNMFLSKHQPVTILETTVAGNPAVWAEGPYLLKYSNGDIDLARMIEGHVLIWEQAGITYRLETDLPLEKAVSIAESIQPWHK
jgi:hypothetical protein